MPASETSRRETEPRRRARRRFRTANERVTVRYVGFLDPPTLRVSSAFSEERMSLMLSQSTPAQKRAEQTARALGLTQFASGIAYGTIEGHLAQVRVVANSSGHCLEVLFRHAGEGKEEALRRAVDESPEVKASGVKS